MPIRFSVYIASSLDGYIARPDGDIRWLTEIPAPPDEDFGYHDFFETVDTLVLGRGTFETVMGFGAWPYEGKRVVVLSQTLHPGSLPSEVASRVEVHHGPVQNLAAILEASGAGHVYVDGGLAIQSFLAEGLINTLIVTRIPMLIGSGIPLFGNPGRDIRLRHVETRSYPNGFVQSRYEIPA